MPIKKVPVGDQNVPNTIRSSVQHEGAASFSVNSSSEEVHASLSLSWAGCRRRASRERESSSQCTSQCP